MYPVEKGSYHEVFDTFQSTPKIQKLMMDCADACTEAIAHGESNNLEYVVSKFLLGKVANLARGDYYDFGDVTNQKSLLYNLRASLSDTLPRADESHVFIQKSIPYMLGVVASLIKNPQAHKSIPLIDAYRKELQDIMGSNDSSKIDLYHSSRAHRKNRGNTEGYLKIDGKKYTFVDGRKVGEVYKTLGIPIFRCETREQVTDVLKKMLFKYKESYPDLREMQSWEMRENELFPLIAQRLTDNNIIYGGFWNHYRQGANGLKAHHNGTHHGVGEKCCLSLPIMLGDHFVDLESKKPSQRAALYISLFSDAAMVAYPPSLMVKNPRPLDSEKPLSMTDMDKPRG